MKQYGLKINGEWLQQAKLVNGENELWVTRDAAAACSMSRPVAAFMRVLLKVRGVHAEMETL